MQHLTDSNHSLTFTAQAPAHFGPGGQICTIPACGHIHFRMVAGWVCRYVSASCKKLAVAVAVAAAPGWVVVMQVDTTEASTVTASTRSWQMASVSIGCCVNANLSTQCDWPWLGSQYTAATDTIWVQSLSLPIFAKHVEMHGQLWVAAT